MTDSPSTTTSSTGTGGNAIRVVIADDHPVVRDGLAGMLGSEDGIAVVGEAGGGVEAVAVVARTTPDVVLMDLRMPAGSGVEAIRALRRTPGRQPRILVLTTYDTDRDVRTAMDAGADGFLLKDTRRADLVRAVRDLAEGRPVLTPAALAVLAGRTGEVPLSGREVEVLGYVAEGRTNRAIASRLGIGEATVKTHLGHVYDKLGVADRASAVRAAWERGLV
ncbi:response regulator [Propionibacteriaceae bacterium Y2011]|uniref:response regulator n=1 Tax=Microlunatus sp. Y2014 TaxID=3418488 RepID=UPI003B4DB964